MKHLLILLCCTFVSSWDEGLMMRAVSSLKKATEFYKRHFHQVNLDSIFGLRAAEGVLSNLLTAHSTEIHSESLKKEIFKIHESIKIIADQAYQHFLGSNEAYINLFKPIVAKQWYYYAPKRFAPTKQQQRQPTNADKLIQKQQELQKDFEEPEMNEVESDFCMSNLMGTQQEGVKEVCVVPKSCWILMTRPNASRYYLTHQGLYFILADVLGCTSNLKLQNQYNKEDMFHDLGTNIFSEINSLKKKGLTTAEDRDLFLEQGLLCTWLGVDFCFAEDTLELVLSWQHKSGCMKEVDLLLDRFTNAGRQLKVEVTLTDGCLSHATGLFTAYLATSIHWLLTENSNQSVLTYMTKNLMSSEINVVVVLIMVFILCFIIRQFCGKRFSLRRLFRSH